MGGQKGVENRNVESVVPDLFGADDIAGLASPPAIGGLLLTTVYANDTFLGFENTHDSARSRFRRAAARSCWQP
jgi:hypothetical protein